MQRRLLYLIVPLTLLFATAAKAGQMATAPGDADSRLSGPAGSGYTAVTYPSDTAVNLGRNADGQITGLNDTSGASNSQTSNFGGACPERSRGDGAGNMTSVGAGLLPAWTLTYNDENQLVNVAHGGVTDTYIYDAGGQPIWDSLRSPSECFALSYDGAREIEDDCDNASYLHDRMTYTGGSFFDLFLGIHQYTLTPAIRYPLFDGTGSVRALVDANGTVQDSYAYDAYGVPGTGNSTNAQPFRYGGDWGYRTSRSTGLLQLGQRWYWPDLGRFTQQDPIGDGANWYAYAKNNPVAEIDPTGLITLPWSPESPIYQMTQPDTWSGGFRAGWNSGYYAGYAKFVSPITIPAHLDVKSVLSAVAGDKVDDQAKKFLSTQGARFVLHLTDKRFTRWGATSTKMVPELAADIGLGVDLALAYMKSLAYINDCGQMVYKAM